ncbi:MAG: aminotransferase class III-fold pyridoxal phosphate-dependent enzyme, partial [Planctomycetales bacterium]|nr:aminotransferase class III-fold pyridoxal phosphate-dependent enzyme [Planctomycetales bacterium]
MNRDRSHAIFAHAQMLMPGGVNSPARAFGAVGGEPIVVARGEGAHLVDVDGNRYIDYIGSWGPMILGHAHPAVTEALARTIQGGTSFGAPT